jgi:AraC-like DNA-binding protein
MSLRPLFAFVKERRMDLAPLLALADLAPSSLDDYDHRIPEAARAQIFIAASERSRDPLFGPHVAEHAQIGVYDVLDYSLYFSATLEQGMENIVRFHRVMCDAWALAIEHRAKTVRLRRIERTPGPECEAALATLLVRSRLLTHQEVAPIEVRFMHRAPSDTSLHEKWFGCPVRFGAPASELVLAAGDFALPVPTANAGVERVLGRYMTEILQRLPKVGSFLELVQAAIARRLHHSVPTLAQTARQLHASPRTLQRRLGEHGVSYRAVVESVRRDLAERLLADGHASVTEIAFLLGFSDVSGFRRMYKRSAGVTPKSVVAKKRRAR